MISWSRSRARRNAELAQCKPKRNPDFLRARFACGAGNLQSGVASTQDYEESVSMPRCSAKAHARSMLLSGEESEAGVTEPSPELQKFWRGLPLARRRKLLRVDRKSIFTRIRQQFCSRCFGELVSFKVPSSSPSRQARIALLLNVISQ